MSVLAAKCPDLQTRYTTWQEFSGKRPIECRFYACPAEEGGFYAYVPSLPGVVSEGETQCELLDNVTDAFRGAVLAYRQAGDAIPWETACEDKPSDAREFRIVVDV